MQSDQTLPDGHVTGPSWKTTHVYMMALICLAVGIAVGYLFRGSQFTAVPAERQPNSAAIPASGETPGQQQMPTLEQMKHMADKKAEPLLAKVKAEPQNSQALVALGDLYKQTHQFKQAAEFYEKALKAEPENAGVRSDLASCLYYSGDADAALVQLQQALKTDPKNAASLFNLGMIRWQGKKDTAGAIAAWKELLKSNPQLDPQRKASVEKLIAQAKQNSTN